jgi:predicted dehydrogenase
MVVTTLCADTTRIPSFGSCTSSRRTTLTVDNERRPDDERPLGVAVVGAGYWGPNLMRNFMACAETDLLWAVDLQPERAAKTVGARSGVRISASIDEMLADDAVDAVAIATPPGSHMAVGMACLDAGKHVLIEKPLATSSWKGQRLVERAAEASLVLMCDHTFCYTPAVRAIRDLVADGTLGDLLYIDSVRVNLGLVQSDIDVFWDLAPHDLSILDHILPEGVWPTAVSAIGVDPIGAGQPCIGYLTLPLNTGAVVHINVNWLSPTKIRQTIVAGSKSMVVWDDMKPYQRLTLVDCGVDVVPVSGAAEKRDRLVNYRMGDMVIPALKETGEALQQVVLEFVGSIREKRAPLTDGASGVRILEILEAVAVSLRANGAMVNLEVTR